LTYFFVVDCPQVQVIHPYAAQQPDELTLLEGDVISVLRKLPDGERLSLWSFNVSLV